MLRRLAAPLLVAVTLLLASTDSIAADRPTYLVCDLGDLGDWYIVIANFGDMDGAVQHCLRDLNGHPAGVE